MPKCNKQAKDRRASTECGGCISSDDWARTGQSCINSKVASCRHHLQYSALLWSPRDYECPRYSKRRVTTLYTDRKTKSGHTRFRRIPRSANQSQDDFAESSSAGRNRPINIELHRSLCMHRVELTKFAFWTGDLEALGSVRAFTTTGRTE